MKILYPILLISLLLGSCSKKSVEEQAKIDDEIIQKYLSDNGITATKASSGIYFVIENPGTGASCNSNSDVQVAYKGYFTDGEVFDESSASGISFNLQGVIEGWTLGIPFFKEGGNGILLIPSALGYGSKKNGSIPANSVLIFDVKLIDVL